LRDLELGLRISLDAWRQGDVATNLATHLVHVLGQAAGALDGRLFGLQLLELACLGLSPGALVLSGFLGRFLLRFLRRLLLFQLRFLAFQLVLETWPAFRLWLGLLLLRLGLFLFRRLLGFRLLSALPSWQLPSSVAP